MGNRQAWARGSMRTKTVPQWLDTQPDPMAAVFDQYDRYSCEPGHGKCDQGRQCMAPTGGLNAARGIVVAAILTLATCSASLTLYMLGQMRGWW
jgi:hypothetical protein